MLLALVPVEEVHVHLHLPQVLVGELAELEVNEHEAAQQPVVKHEVDVEVVAVEGDALLPGHEAEALAQLQQERLQVVDDGLLQVALQPVGALLQLQELEHHRIL